MGGESTTGSETTRHLDCPQQCVIPEGWNASFVPPPRHAWGDVHRCPNDGCGRYVIGSRANRSDAEESRDA